jgi:hypothetical protein
VWRNEEKSFGIADMACTCVCVGCAHLSSEHAKPGLDLVHFNDPSVAIYDRPAGHLLADLYLSSCWQLESRDRYTRIACDYPLRVDAWVMTDVVERGPIETSAPHPPDIDDKEPLAATWRPRISRDAEPLRIAPDEHAASVGFVERGTKVLLNDQGTGWMRVLPEGNIFEPAEGAALWVRAPAFR